MVKINKRRAIDLLVIVILLFCLIMLGLILNYIKTEGYSCIKNPYTFGANKMAVVNKAEVICSCNLLSKGNTPTFYFDRNKSWAGNNLNNLNN